MTRRDLDTRPVFHSPPDGDQALLEQWLATPALRSLVEAEGGAWPAGGLVPVLEELERFSAAWDYRGGQSRLMFHGSSESRTDDRARIVYGAARDLGLLDSAPPTMTEPDYLIILGGLATGIEPRALYAAELVDQGHVSPGHLLGLGSFRPVDEREHEAAARYAPAARTELDLMAAMTGRAFGADNSWTITTEGDPLAAPAHAQEIRSRPGRPPISLYAARSSDPDQRPANTTDTYRQFADAVAIEHGQALLIITSTIYRPYQHLEALRALGHYGVTIETVGVPADPQASPKHPPSAYLQELRSTIRSARALMAPPR